MKRILLIIALGILLVGGFAVADIFIVSNIDKDIRISKEKADIMECMGYGNLTITEYQLPTGEIKRCIEEMDMCEIFDVFSTEIQRDEWEKSEIEEHAKLLIKRGHTCETKTAEGTTNIMEETK